MKKFGVSNNIFVMVNIIFFKICCVGSWFCVRCCCMVNSVCKFWLCISEVLIIVVNSIRVMVGYILSMLLI